MALFGRKKSNDSAVPEDLQQYYSSGNSGIGKWILRVILFVLVLALLVWAGIWLFNKLTGSNDEAVSNPTTATQQLEEDKAKAAQDKAKADAAANKKAADAKAKADAEAKKAEEARKKAAAEANQKIAEAQSQADGAAPAPASPAPAAPGAATPPPTAATALPNTGPSSAALAGIFAGVSVVGAFLHSLYARRRQTN